MKEIYEVLSMEVIAFDAEDVITDSEGGGGYNDGGQDAIGPVFGQYQFCTAQTAGSFGCLPFFTSIPTIVL